MPGLQRDLWICSEELAQAEFTDRLDCYIPVDSQPLGLRKGDCGAPLGMFRRPILFREAFSPASYSVVCDLVTHMCLLAIVCSLNFEELQRPAYI